MIAKLKDVLERARDWPETAQQELAEIALEIEAGLGDVCRATPEELRALDEAEQSGIASDEDVAAAFKAFLRA